MGKRDGIGGGQSWRGPDGGPREFNEAQYGVTVAFMRDHCTGPTNVKKQRDMLAATPEMSSVYEGYDGRTLRAVLREADGVEFCLGGGDEGVFVADCWEDSQGMTGRMASQVSNMSVRIDRRRTFAGKHLPRRQPDLPGM